jgi:AAA family ATP:ADP antiporter
MGPRIRALFDIREGEGFPVLFTFLYIASVMAAVLLAKPIRNSLFLTQYGAEKLVYVYVTVPLVLSVFVPIYTSITPRFGQRTVITGTLLFFSLNALAFWYLFRFHAFHSLPGIFYVWLSCFSIIAPVQVWTFANSVFDTRQAKRLFSLIASGASIGAIAGGVLGTVLLRPLGGTVNLLILLAVVIAMAAVTVNLTRLVIPPRPSAKLLQLQRVPFRRTLQTIRGTRYLTLLAASVFLVAIVTQWSQFQLSVLAEQRYPTKDEITRFFALFNSYLGATAFLVQLALTGTALRRFGIGFTLLLLPLSLGAGSLLIVLFPVLWSVLLTNALDQGLRFSIDKATYELLYLPLPANVKNDVKVTIDTVINRFADSAGGLLLGLATAGFPIVLLPGLGLGIRGIAALNLILIGLWATIAVALRRGYVDVIRESIQKHRIDAERSSSAVFDRSTNAILADKLKSDRPEEVLYALSLFEAQQQPGSLPAVRELLRHGDPVVRRRALAVLASASDGSIVPEVERLLTDPDLETRTDALLYLAYHTRIDPLARIEALGDFPDFSIRAGMVAFLAAPGRLQNVDAARLLLAGMVRESGPDGRRHRLEAARLIGALPDVFGDELAELLRDPDVEVVRHAIRAVGRLKKRACLPLLLHHLGNADLTTDVIEALGRLGDGIVGTVRDLLFDPGVPIEVRREIPSVFVRIGTPAAERALTESLLEADTTLRFRVISSLNKLRRQNPRIAIDTQVVEIALAAEIMGHYRSYQILGTLGGALDRDDPVVTGLRRTMEQEVERIFRLLGLQFPEHDLHSAYFGLRSGNAAVRANSLEFLDNILKPQLRSLLVPLLDSYVTVAERVRLANRMLGTEVQSQEQAVAVLIASDDPWMRSCAAYAIGTLRLASLEAHLDRWLDDPDPLVRETARSAKGRLAAPPPAEPAPEAEETAEPWSTGSMGVG